MQEHRGDHAEPRRDQCHIRRKCGVAQEHSRNDPECVHGLLAAHRTERELPQENEDIAAAFSAAHPEFEPLRVGGVLAHLKVPQAPSLTAGGPDNDLYLRLWPHRHGTDGFFAAAWVKN